MNITLKTLHIENFKGITEKTVDFSNKTNIKGMNRSGKTTLVDAFLWLIFDKNSDYSTKFGIRPVDGNGNTIHYVEIKVSAVLNINGEDKEFTKVQKENWVKHRGSEESVFQGNVNTFEIDGYPRSEREFKEVVSGMIDEEMFKMLTSPTYFTSLPWKKQRDTLMKFATAESDYDMAVRLGGFDAILDELKKAPSTADIQNKYARTMKELKAHQTELPTRIDEVSKQKVDYDVAELTAKKEELESLIANAKSGVNDSVLNDLKSQQMNAEFELSAYKMNAEKDVKLARSEKESKVFDIESKLRVLNADLTAKINEISVLKTRITSKENELTALGNDYFKLNESKFDESKYVFDENSTICSLCGQKLPESKIEDLKQDFEKTVETARQKFEAEKKSTMQKLVDNGNFLKTEVAECKSKISNLEDKVKTINVEIEQNTKVLVGIKDELSKMPLTADMTADPKFTALEQKVAEIKAKITEIQNVANASAVDTTSYKCELDGINQKLAQISNNAKIDERIEQLKAEQRDTAQKISNCEAVVFALENFIKAKMNEISIEINSKFDGVTWRLFKQNINGSIEEECSCCVNGVPYSDVNNGHKIVAGLQIIKTLSNLYDLHAPIFTDNAEAVNSFNLPEMACQMILLSVSDDKELVIESED